MKTVDVKAQVTAVALTRKEKLLRWSELIRATSANFYIFHRLEHWNPRQLKMAMAEHGIPLGYANAFIVAAADPVFRAAGLAGDSVADSMRFFELSLDDMHGFSCDCGGAVEKTDMAHRIEHLATAHPHRVGGSFAGYFRSMFGSLWVTAMLAAAIGESLSHIFS
jgi:hypothetical protein